MSDHEIALASHVVIFFTSLVGLMTVVVNLVILLVRLKKQDHKLEEIHREVRNGNGGRTHE